MESPKITIDSSLMKRLIAGEPLFKPRVPWPSPRDSIGEEYVVEGRYRCWEAIGPAHQIENDLFARIGSLLDSCNDILNDGVSKPLQLSFVMLMVGRTEDQARPTITFCCGNKAPRQQAMKLLRGSAILAEHPAVQLAEATKPPYLTKSPIPLAGRMVDDAEFQSIYGNLVTSSQRVVYYSLPLNTTCGIPIAIRESRGDRPAARHYASMGLIRIGDQLLGHTVAHLFSDFLEESKVEDDIGFALEYESSEEDSEDEGFIAQTSRGSISLMSFDSVDTAGNNSSLTTESSVTWPDSEPLMLNPISTRPKISNTHQMSLGRLWRINDLSTSLDSALVELSDVEYLDYNTAQTISAGLAPDYLYDIVKSPQARASVVAKTSFGDIAGTKFGGSTFMRLPNSPKMQQMWTIRLEGLVKPGVCGSWVVNPVDRTLYGHIALGDPGSSVAYVIPAYQVFTDIERCLSSKVTLPSKEFMAERGKVKLGSPSFPSMRNSKEPAITHDSSTFNIASRVHITPSSSGSQETTSVDHLNKSATANSLSKSPPSQANHHPVAKFLEWVSTVYVNSIVDPNNEKRRGFVPASKLEMYFTDNQYQNLTGILKALYSPAEPPIDVESIAERYTRVLAILLLIGKGTYISQFVRYRSLRDHHLPFSSISPPAHFPRSTKDSNLFDIFYKKQWEFCAPDFQRHMQDEYFEEEAILPIICKERIGNGGSGVLYKIKIHEEYNKLLSGNPSTKLRKQSSNIFTLKTYHTGETSQADYAKEVQAFRKLRPAANIADFYGTYTQGNTFNILLEYADKGTLEHFFKEEPQPKDEQDIIKFWQNLFKLSEALMAIHKIVEPLGSSNGAPMFLGWHQDIKPANILVVEKSVDSKYEAQFMLADLGLGHFQGKANQSINSPAIGMHSTCVYGAPEYYSAADDPVNTGLSYSVADVWSLGCVYSVAARWIVEGYGGISAYEKERKAETSRIRAFKDSPYFHNGNTVLEAVQESHRKTIQQLRAQDHITEKVTDLVADMLEVRFGRLTVTQVWYKSQRILAEAHKKVKEMKENYEATINRNNPAYRSLQQHPPRPPKDSPTISAGFQPPLTPPPEIALPAKPSLPPSMETNNKIPYLSIDDALAWKMGKKRSVKRNSLPDQHLLHRLSRRDHIFLVDDSTTMARHWPEVIRVFAALSCIVKASDHDGIELHFKIAPQVYRDKHTTQLLQSLESKNLEELTDINFRLNEILDRYRAKLPGNGTLKSSLRNKTWPWKLVPPLSVYILTNGIWESKTNVEAPIVNLMRDLIDLRLSASQIGIQFISFGDDPKGIQRLQFLDSGLKQGCEEWLDIVDTEPSNGNVWKMLLGAINPTFGDDNHEMGTEELHCDETKGDVVATVSRTSQPTETSYTTPIMHTRPSRAQRHREQRVHARDIWN